MMVSEAGETNRAMGDDEKKDLRDIRELLLEADKRGRLSAHLIESLHGTVRDIANEQVEQRKQIAAHRDDFAEHRLEDIASIGRLESNYGRLSIRVGALEKREEKVEQELEDTGRYRLNSLHRQLKEQTDSATWWKRHHITVIVGFVSAVVSAGAAILVAWLTKILHLK